MTKDEALKLALEFFETMQRYKGVRSNIFIKFEPTATGDYVDLREFDEKAKPIITVIEQALAAPVQEPVAWNQADELQCPICKITGRPYPKCGCITYAAPTAVQPVKWSDYELNGSK